MNTLLSKKGTSLRPLRYSQYHDSHMQRRCSKLSRRLRPSGLCALWTLAPLRCCPLQFPKLETGKHTCLQPLYKAMSTIGTLASPLAGDVLLHSLAISAANNGLFAFETFVAASLEAPPTSCSLSGGCGNIPWQLFCAAN